MQLFRSEHVLLFVFLSFLPSFTLAQHDCRSAKQALTGGPKGGGGTVELWPFDILHQRIELDLTLGNTIAGRCDVTATPRDPDQIQLQLHLLALQVDSVTNAEGTLLFDQQDELLTIHFAEPIAIGDTIELSIHYQGDPAVDPSGFGGFYTTSAYIYNLGVAFENVPHSFGRAWFPCVDNFTERNTYDFLVKTHAGRNAWCNGELIEEIDLGGDTLIRHWNMPLPIPTYLASVAAANYVAVRDTFPSIAGNEVPVALVARAQDTTNMKNSLINLPQAFEHFEDLFGHYRWNKVGYIATPVGAMEHSTSIHYPTSIINGNLTFEQTMAHELAHEWFGNLVTCERAEEMYLNEGFAEFLSLLFLEDVYGRDRYLREIRSNHRKMVHQAHLVDEGWWALADVPQQWTYGEHSYNKGADVLHSLRGYLGDDLFSLGLTSFLNDHAFQPVNSTMLRDHLTSVTGMDMTDFFNDWIFQPGWAAFEVDSFSIGTDNVTTIHLQQKLRGADHFYHNVPLTVTCIDANGDRWTAPDRIMGNGEFSSATIEPPFVPELIILNADELISLAITADEDTLTQNGSITYPNGNMRLTVASISDPVPIRIEQYWVAADDAQDGFAYVISPDRWWRVIGNIPAGTTINGRIDFDGRPTAVGSLDVGLIENFGGIEFHEDSLVLLYRPDQHWPWTAHPDQNVITLTNTSDGWGRLEFNGVLQGEYTLAWRKSAVGIGSIERDPIDWSIHPNPATDLVILDRKGDQRAGTVELIDKRGRIVRCMPINSDRTEIDVNGIAAGHYQLRFTDRNGRSTKAGRVSIVR